MNLSHIFDGIINFLVIFIQKVGYLGVFIGMFIESTPFPLPSEVIMIPVGIAASHQSSDMNVFLVILIGVLGNLFGAIFSYMVAASFGRAVLIKIGKYFFISEKVINKMENFFYHHGTISIFVSRLLPGFRHLISFAAGTAKMNFSLFCFYTTLGSAFWTSTLVTLGYFIGKNQELIKQYLNFIVIFCIIFSGLIILFYSLYHEKIKKRDIA
jgi:membrane protein DedA with SNARE-associated domain